MSFTVNFGPWGTIFPVPTAVVDQHIKLCGATQLKVLLLVLRSGKPQVDVPDLCKQLNLSTADVHDALNYWVNCGILQQEEPAQTQGIQADPFAPPAPEPAVSQAPTERPPISTTVQTPQGQRVTTISSRRHLTQQEIAVLAAQDPKVSVLVQEAQARLGKPLSPTETEALISLYQYGGMDIDLILMVIEYCKSIDKTSMRYVERTAYNWLDSGIDTHERAEAHIKELMERHSQEGQVRAAFGLGSRALTTSEKRYIHRWFHDFGFDIALIRLAYERTVDSTGSLSYPYLNKILANWHEKGITTPEQACAEMSVPPARPKGRTPAATGQKKASYDLAEIERMITYGDVLSKQEE